MADPTARSPQTTNLYNILGLSKTASLADIGKAYKSLVMKWNPDRHASNKDEAEAKISSIHEAYRVLSTKKREEADRSNHDDHKSPENSHHHRSMDLDDDGFVISSPTLVSSTSNRVTPTGTPRKFSDGSSGRGTNNAPTSRESGGYSRSSSGPPEMPTSPTAGLEEPTVSFSRITSKRTPTPIIFSHTTARKKAQPIQKKLECTLEELCHGCAKKVKITREVISSEGYVSHY